MGAGGGGWKKAVFASEGPGVVGVAATIGSSRSFLVLKKAVVTAAPVAALAAATRTSVLRGIPR